MGPINCNGCTACCWNDRVPLTPEEARVFAHTVEPDGPKLARKPDGSCLYLNAAGCSVHAARPAVCAEFDCRDLVASLPKRVPFYRTVKEASNPAYAAVFRAGEQRLGALSSTSAAAHTISGAQA